ncbi:uncharacterized protein LOC143180844 [Calliopsis andreniformis]|uniref:uncharacterized protein LOC143180844 n=1 Tax=Calliopsis andreniformis TaxID=337506 RepID=UPI003FCE839C
MINCASMFAVFLFLFRRSDLHAARFARVTFNPRAHACAHVRMLARNIIALIRRNWGSAGLTRVLEASTC